MDQCVARFDRFELSLSGSLAADILHWFRESLAKAMQSRIEQVIMAFIIPSQICRIAIYE